jgi:hypothetical protein
MKMEMIQTIINVEEQSLCKIVIHPALLLEHTRYLSMGNKTLLGSLLIIRGNNEKFTHNI